jgi:hypothetical protein
VRGRVSLWAGRFDTARHGRQCANQRRASRSHASVRTQATSLDFTTEALYDVARDLRFKLGDAGIPLEDIVSSGLGYANLLYIATVIVELAKARDADLTLFLVEEPEAHLHPQLQMLMLDFLLLQANKSAQRPRRRETRRPDSDRCDDTLSEPDRMGRP